ncbi:MAG: GreA/GreB family elongation factor [Betaproteobacteria bacterium]
MFDLHDLVLSTHDAAVLSAAVTDWPARVPSEQAAAELLAATLAGAHLVSDRSTASGYVALDATVTYDELPAGRRRTVTLVHPARADASLARVSLFTPVARTLLGRRAGASVPARLPDRSIRELRIVSVEREGGGHVDPL